MTQSRAARSIIDTHRHVWGPLGLDVDRELRRASDKLVCCGVATFMSLPGSKRGAFMSRVLDGQQDAHASRDQEGPCSPK